MGTEDVKFSHVFTSQNPGRLTDFYDLEKKKLGEGSYGTVCKAVNKATGAVRACKAINIAKISDPARFQQEIDIQMKLDHPNIVKLYETFRDARMVYLIMELSTGGELFDRIVEESEKHDGHAFSEKEVARYMAQILGAMQYLHDHQYAHRDIKPENFLLQTPARDAEIKVIDFGLSKHFDPKVPMKTKAGTPYYVAPEVLTGSGYFESCDIWSCGVICYILLCGYPPFYGDSDREILMAVKKGKFDFPSDDWKDTSNSVKDFITKMLTLDPSKRPTAKDMFSHPWLTEAGSQEPIKIDREVGKKMRSFRSQSKMKKIVLTMIAQNCKDEDMEELRRTWVALDKNRDGTLTMDEIEKGLMDAKVDIPSDFREVLESLDTDKSGHIDYSEFLAATVAKAQYMKEELAWSSFRQFDTDGDGIISKDELFCVLQDMKVAQEIMSEVDLDQSGGISFDEFQAMLAKERV